MKTKIFNFIQNVLFILSIVICVFILAQKFIFKENGVFGYRTFVIITSSMQPHLEIGDVIIVKSTDPKLLRAGDIITYLGEVSDFKGKIVTHIIKNIEEDNNGKLLFYTKGTVTNMVDPVVKEKQIYGKMVYRFYLISLISKLIRSKIGFVIIIFIPLLIILVKQLLNIKKEVKENCTCEITEITNEQIKEYKKTHKKKFVLFKKKSKKIDKNLDNNIITVKETNDELEKTIYSSEFKKEIENELNKTLLSNDIKNEINKKIEEEEKVQKPLRGLENTIIDSNLKEELEEIEEKVPDIIFIED